MFFVVGTYSSKGNGEDTTSKTIVFSEAIELYESNSFPLYPLALSASLFGKVDLHVFEKTSDVYGDDMVSNFESFFRQTTIQRKDGAEIHIRGGVEKEQFLRGLHSWESIQKQFETNFGNSMNVNLTHAAVYKEVLHLVRRSKGGVALQEIARITKSLPTHAQLNDARSPDEVRRLLGERSNAFGHATIRINGGIKQQTATAHWVRFEKFGNHEIGYLWVIMATREFVREDKTSKEYFDFLVTYRGNLTDQKEPSSTLPKVDHNKK